MILFLKGRYFTWQVKYISTSVTKLVKNSFYSGLPCMQITDFCLYIGDILTGHYYTVHGFRLLFIAYYWMNICYSQSAVGTCTILYMIWRGFLFVYICTQYFISLLFKHEHVVNYYNLSILRYFLPFALYQDKDIFQIFILIEVSININNYF